VFTDPLPSNRCPIVERVGSRGNVFTEPVPGNGSIKNSVALVRKQIIPTEGPTLFGEVNAYFCRYRVSRGQCNGFPQLLISVF
jgi:hypothetical protein